MAGILPATVLSSQRRLLASRDLPDTATIQSKTRTTGAQGNTYVYATVAADVACRFRSAGARERAQAVALGYEIDGRFTFAWDQTVTLGQRILYNSATYEVIATNVDSAWRRVTKVEVKRLTQT